MTIHKVGSRVFAILSSNKDNVYLIGKGTYLGDLPFKDANPNVRLFGFLPSELEKEAPGFTNPCLKMDDGTIVWGCECWWGAEDGLEKLVGGRTVINVDMEKARQENI
jgi:hypothetical protein